MEPYDYDTEQSLQSLPQSSNHSTSGAPGSSADGIDAHKDVPRQQEQSQYLTLTTRRRLIRKPLPNVPSQTDGAAGRGRNTSRKSTASDAHNEASRSKSHVSEEDGRDLGNGLQDAIASSGSNIGSSHLNVPDEPLSERSPLPHSAIFARHGSPQRHVMTLGEARQVTAEIEQQDRDILQWWPLADPGTSSEPHHYGPSSSQKSTDGLREQDDQVFQIRLDSLASRHLLQIIEYSLHTFLALGDAERTRTADTMLKALQDCLEEITEPKALALLQQTSSVLWRVEAIVRSNEQLQGSRSGLAALLGVLGVRWPRLVPWRGRESSSAAGSAAATPSMTPLTTADEDSEYPFSSSRRSSSTYSPAYGTEQRRRKRDVAMQLLSNTLWMSGLSAGDAAGALSVLAPDAPLSGEAEAPKKDKTSNVSGFPKLLSKAVTPTVALSSMAGSTDEIADTSNADETSMPTATSKDEDTSSIKTSDSTSGERSSMLTDRLAMQLRSNAERSSAEAVKGSQNKLAEGHATPGGISRSTSSSSLVPVEQVTQSSSGVKITVCRVYASFDEDVSEAEATKQNTEANDKEEDSSTPVATRRLDTLASTTRSEGTIRDLLQSSTDSGPMTVQWHSNVFQGQALHLNPLSTDVEGRDMEEGREGINIVGGSFLIRGCDEDHRDSIRDTLDVALYAACAMLLERSVLQNFDAYRAESPERSVPRGAKGLRHTFEGSPTSISADSPHIKLGHAEDGSDRSGRWHHGLWQILNGSSDATPEEATETVQTSQHKDPSSPLHTVTPDDNRKKTSESQVKRFNSKPGAHIAPYARWGKNLLTSVYRKAAGQEALSTGRPRSQADVVAASTPDMKEVEGSDKTLESPPSEAENIRQKARDVPTRPQRVSPYRKDASLILHSEANFLEGLVSRQSMGLVILEGQDVSLPFGQAPQRHSQLGSSSAEVGGSAAFRKQQSHNDLRGSTLSAHTGTSASTAGRLSSLSPTQQQTASDANRAGASPSALQDDVEKRRREIFFYQRGGVCRDTMLGQAVEEMAAKAVVLSSEHLLRAKTAKKEKDASTQDSKGLALQTFRIAQYLHGESKVIVCASLIDEAEQSGKANLQPTTHPPADISGIASMLKTNQQIAQTALMLSESSKVAQRQQPSGVSSPAQSQSRPLSGNGEPAIANTNSTANQLIEMWQADMRNDRQSSVKKMSDAAYLSSFGNFLEAIIAHPQLTDASRLPAESVYDVKDLQRGDARFDKDHIVRMFRVGQVLLKFHVRPVVVYDLLIDGPVVVTSSHVVQASKKDATHLLPTESTVNESSLQQAQTSSWTKEVRLDVQHFFASLKSQISKMEHLFVARELDGEGKTVKGVLQASNTPSVRSAISVIPSDASSKSDSTISEAPSMSDAASLADAEAEPSEGTAKEPLAKEPLELLSRLQASFRKVEFALYDSLKSADILALNDIRHELYERAKSAKSRVHAWAIKHLTKAELDALAPLKYDEPFYFERGNFAFPGSSYILRQDEPLSIIAYSLSSRDFRDEIVYTGKDIKTAHVLNWRSAVSPNLGPSSGHHSEVKTPRDQKSQASASDGRALDTGTKSLDPDEHEDFGEPEPVRVNMKRKKHSKEAGILSLRIRSGHQAAFGEDSSFSQESRGNSPPQDDTDLGDSTVTPTASRTSPSEASGQNFSTVSSRNDTFQAHISSVPPHGTLAEIFSQPLGGANVVEPLVTPSDEGDRQLGAGSMFSSSVGSTGTAMQRTLPERLSTPSTPGFDGADGAHKSGPRLPSPLTPASPHVKHILQTGNVKISCVSWFAEDFAKLRARWGIEQDFVESLSRSKTWSNAGGKSKSGFYLTGDGKWIAKQLLNVWTVDEKEAFLEFAPAYLRYMMNSVTNDCPTLLVKIAGVYSLKIKDVKTGEVKLKLSVQVLENVFAGDDGRSIRFDLKGIRERRVAAAKTQLNAPSQGQPSAAAAATASGDEERASVWWDGEWLDALQPRAFVPEEDKAVFRRALRNDLAFLTASNVMDYSLLVGVHEQDSLKQTSDAKTRPWFRVRIVDFLGAWTLVKQLESSSKKAIKSQTPTVIPPQDYAARFREAVESYFIGCPGTRTARAPAASQSDV